MRLNSHSIKEQSIIGVYKSIEKSGRVTRNEIAAGTGRSVVTVCKMVDLLVQNQLLVEEKEETSAVGRKATNLMINFAAKTVLILDLTKKRFSARLLYLDNQDAVPKFRFAYDKEHSFEDNLDVFLSESKAALFGAEDSYSSCIGLGVIVPGPYLTKKDQVINKRLPEFLELKLKEHLETYYPNQFLLIEEDVKLAGLHSAGLWEKKNSHTLFYAYIDEGVGGSVISNGQLAVGAHSFAGDFGQFMFGNKTCVEEEICIPRFFENIGITNGNEKSADALFEELDLNHPDIQQKIRELEEKVALAVYNVCWLLDPYCIIIESKYCKYFPDFVDHVSENLRDLLGEFSENLCPKLVGQNGTVQNAYKGAAELVLDQYLTSL